MPTQPSSRGVRRAKVRALILARRSLGEADRQLTFFTRSNGLLPVLAVGVRRIPSRRGGHLEPMTQVLSIISGTTGRYFLTAVETLERYPALLHDHEALGHAQALSAVMTMLFHEEEPQPALFDQLAHSWQRLPRLSATARCALEINVTLQALQAAGLAPALAACHRCGATQPREAVILDGLAGGWRCLSCHDSLAGTRTSLPPRLLQALRVITRHPAQATRLAWGQDESRQTLMALRTYVSRVTGVRQHLLTRASSTPYG